jgi:hypothetical protein
MKDKNKQNKETQKRNRKGGLIIRLNGWPDLYLLRPMRWTSYIHNRRQVMLFALILLRGNQEPPSETYQQATRRTVWTFFTRKDDVIFCAHTKTPFKAHIRETLTYVSCQTSIGNLKFMLYELAHCNKTVTHASTVNETVYFPPQIHTHRK